MKHNHNIDFFSSPHTRLIPFSLGTNIQYDIVNYPDPDHDHDDNSDLERVPPRKSSYNQSYEPIKLFDPNFFNEKLSEYDDQQQLSKQLNYQDNQLKNNRSQVEISEQINQDHSNEYISQEDERQSQNHYSNFEKELLYQTPKKKNLIKKNVFENTTIEKDKILARSNQKGLRKLSNLAFSIVNNSTPTTYKQVAQKLLGKLNFDPNQNQLNDEESRMQKNSMQNVKRRVYDSLNVLIALGVIKRVGNKITKQKQKRTIPLNQNNSGFQQNQKYQQMFEDYERLIVNLQSKKKTQKELKQKLEMFRSLIERNKKTKTITKNNKIIKFPFLAFIAKNVLQGAQSNNVRKIGTENVEINYQSIPQSYGDLDYVRLLKTVQSFEIQKEN